MIDISKIETLMLLMAKHGLDVIQVESGQEKVSLARNAAAAAFLQPSAPQTTTQASVGAGGASSIPPPPSASPVSMKTAMSHDHMEHAPTPATVVPQSKIPEGTTVTSPLVGAFYRAPGPTASNFVEVGTRVKKGQTLCIVEAMKLMNEVESELDGEVVAILIENGKPVEFGTPLFVIR